MISITRRVYFKRAVIAIFLVFLIWISFLIWPQTASAESTAKPPVVRLAKYREPDRWSEKKMMLRQATTTTTTTTTAPKPPVRISANTKEAPSSVVGTVSQLTIPDLPWVGQCENWMTQAGIAQENWPYAIYIIQHESSCSPTAQNPGSTAYGIGQFLNTTWLIPRVVAAGCIKGPDPVMQLHCMEVYVNGRGGWYKNYLIKKSSGIY